MRLVDDRMAERRALRLPSFGGQKFLLPVRFSPEHSFEFFEVDPGAEFVSINEDELLQVSFQLSDRVRDPASATETKIMQLDQIQMGPWIKQGVEFLVCRNCNSTLGQSLLTEFNVYEQIEDGVRFLILRPQ